MTAATCRECGPPFDRQPGTPRVCEPCVPDFKRRLVREGTPIHVYRYPAEVLGDRAHVERVQRLARRAARYAVASSSPSERSPRTEAGRKTVAALDRLFQATDTGRLRYWAGCLMISPNWNGATGQGGIWAAASRLVNERALAVLKARGDAWRAAGLGAFATPDAVREAGL